MVRKDWKSLNGLWDYAVTPLSQKEWTAADGQILVPFCIESSLSGVGRRITANDVLWYRRSFDIPASWRKKHTILNFGAVDWCAEVTVNGQPVASHTGGYTSFSMDITPYLVKGKTQTVQVRVYDATDNDFQPRGKQVTNPGSIWYTPVSGIWQSVWIEPVDETHITGWLAESDIDNGTVNISAEVADAVEGDKLVYEITGEGKTFTMTGNPSETVPVKVDDMHLWSPDDPFLYDVRISVLHNGKTVDKIDGYTAMRKISVVTDADGHKRMALNNEPLFQFGPLDQGWWPDGLYTAPTDEAMRYDIVKTKQYGFNMIRKHIKIEPDSWFFACDQLGMLVWQDMPSFANNHRNIWSQAVADRYDSGTDWPVTDEIRDNYYKEWTEIIEQKRNYPCIVVWVPFNEAWGQFDTEKVAEYTKALDGTRLVNYASGGNWLSTKPGDICDSHHYPQPKMRIWEPEQVNVLGEYGGIGLPIEGHLWQIDRKWGYIQYDNPQAVTDQFVKYSEMLLPLVKEGCSAAVYTQTTDVEGEVNGLMTYDREIDKVDPVRAREANLKVIESMNR